MKVIYLIFLSLILSNLLLAFDLKQAIELAVKNSPQLKAAHNHIEAQSLTQKNAFYSLLPDLRLSASQSLNKTLFPSETKLSWPSAVRLSLDQVIFSKSANMARYEKEKLNYKVSLTKWEEIRENIILDVAKNYYEFVLIHKQLELKKAKYGAVKTELTRLKSMHMEGLKRRIDLIRLQAQLERENIQIIQSTKALAQQENNLKLALGLSLNDPLFDQIKFVIEDPRELFKILPLEKPKLVLNKSNQRIIKEREANQADYKFKKKSLYPELNFNVSLNYQRAGDLPKVLGSERNIFGSFGLFLSFDQFLWGQSSRDVAINGHNLEAKNYLLSVEELKLEKEASDLRATLNELEQSFALNKKLLDLENENYKYLSAEYHRGKIQYLDLITSMSAVFAAKDGYYSSYYNLIIAVIRFYHLQGDLYEKIAL